MTFVVPLSPVKQAGSLMQLVLFPETVGTDALPLDECARFSVLPASAEAEEPVEFASAPAPGQLPLFSLA